MDPLKFPSRLLSQELMAALDAVFPPHSPVPSDTLPDLMYKAGQRRVVDFLQAKFDEMYEQQEPEADSDE